MKRALTAMVVVSHPDPTSLNHALATAVRDALEQQGLQTELFDLHADGFDPVITKEEARGRASNDRQVIRHIGALREAAIVAVVHPNCWGAPPAMMKGWVDRVFAPGAAYAFEKGQDDGEAPVGLLKTEAAIVLNTSNTSAERETERFGDPLDRIWRECLLGYCGVQRIERRVFRVVATSNARDRERWLVEARSLARDVALGVGCGR